jgi:flavin reductase (DIM6/NTAB) family NADH-FMN oxidoreductase RutF
MSNISIPAANKVEEFITYDMNSFDDPYHLLNSIVVPRPIAFITSYSPKGVINAAPFSYFNIVSTNPPILSIAIEKRKGVCKDTSKNIASAKEFTVNVCSVNIAQALTLAAADFPSDISEIEITKLSLLPSEKISTPRIANTLIQMECVLSQIIKVGKGQVDLILGEIVKIHLHKDILNDDGRIDFEKLNPIARLSGSTYAKLSDFFNIPRHIVDTHSN